jgi:hypothetical protein
MSGRERELLLVPISVAGRLRGAKIVAALAAYATYASRSGGQAMAGIFVVFDFIDPHAFLLWVSLAANRSIGPAIQ